VIVVANVIVAALVSGNDTVGVIDTVDDDRACDGVQDRTSLTLHRAPE
jgi:hypothetical protein